MKLLINTGLFLLAIILIIFIGVPSFIIIIIHLFFLASTGRTQRVSTYIRRNAVFVDILGNIICGPFFNLVLITKTATYKFGERPETVSKVLGMNELNGTLTKLGKRVVRILNKVEENHCLKATMTEF